MQALPIRAAGCREQINGRCCADGAPSGGDGRCISGREGGPLGELFEPLFLRRDLKFNYTGTRNTFFNPRMLYIKDQQLPSEL